MITVVIPSSPIESHPDTDIIRAVVDSVHYHLPDSEILLTFDGLRPEQEHWRERYEEYKRRCQHLSVYDRAWRKVEPIVFDEHLHQSGMMRRTLPMIRTPLLMYCEHDMLIRTGRVIDFDAITRFILNGCSDCVRLYLRTEIPELHQEFMHGFDDRDPWRRFLITSQWSQNVHVATVDLYKTLLAEYFTANANCYIEDAVWGRIKDAHPRFKLHIYHPREDPKYLLHLDGRRGDSKYETEQVY